MSGRVAGKLGTTCSVTNSLAEQKADHRPPSAAGPNAAKGPLLLDLHLQQARS